MENISIYFYFLTGSLVLILGFIIGWFVSKKIAKSHMKHTQKLAETIIAEAQREAETRKKASILEAKDEWYQAKLKFEKDTAETRGELRSVERRIEEKEENINRKVNYLEKREQELIENRKVLENKLDNLNLKKEEITKVLHLQNEKLEKIAGLSSEEAKKLLIANLEGEAKLQAARKIKEIKDEAERNATKAAREIITLAIERCAADHVVESTVSVVDLPNDEMKGRIIGREGRNIRAFETATGIDVIIDDTPEAVILSGFDPIRREVARIALSKLVKDGRIHPGRIEELVEKTKKELMEEIREIGEQTYLELNMHGLHPEMVKLLGRLKYRTSYGQNVLQHSKEVAFVASLLASELGLDPVIAKRAGLLHDIGKAVDHEIEGPHAEIGADLAKRYGEAEIVINAIASHHEDVEATSLMAHVISAADSISGARPGARRETLENYIRRLEKLERIADGFDGVEKSYAIQAGREIRILVSYKKIDDAQSIQLASDISRRIEDEMEYPGQIKVVVIRETRSIDFAK
ncbi:MAG: ribonuclease Y [Candidatus Krumholzibacteriota bacterium]|nr:ribonuclease Y [Candidatus Krumholzibacteriota bacterium]